MVLASLHDFSFTYEYSQEPALRDVTLELEEGRLYGIVGLNASGKTTLCSVLRGICPHFHKGALAGDVRVLGKALMDWEPAELAIRIGYLFQNPFTQISGVKGTVFEEIAFGLENLGINRSDIFERVSQVVSQLGLWPIAENNPNDLSGGQSQKVAFASIIVMDPRVLIFDEPTSQLDPESSEEIVGIIGRLQERGKSIVLAEHKVDLLAEVADELIVMRNGEVELAGDTKAVLTSAKLIDASVRPPDVTKLALLLQEQGRGLAELPTTRAEARNMIADRIGRARGANRSR